MEKEPFFIYDPNYRDQNDFFRKITLMLDEEERAKAKFMQKFMLALMKTKK